MTLDNISGDATDKAATTPIKFEIDAEGNFCIIKTKQEVNLSEHNESAELKDLGTLLNVAQAFRVVLESVRDLGYKGIFLLYGVLLVFQVAWLNYYVTSNPEVLKNYGTKTNQSWKIIKSGKAACLYTIYEYNEMGLKKVVVISYVYGESNTLIAVRSEHNIEINENAKSIQDNAKNACTSLTKLKYEILQYDSVIKLKERIEEINNY